MSKRKKHADKPCSSQLPCRCTDAPLRRGIYKQTGGAWPLHNMHLQAGMANGWRVGFHYLSWMMYEAVFQQTVRPEKGWVTVPDTPGLGLDPKPGIIKEYRQTR